MRSRCTHFRLTILVTDELYITRDLVLLAEIDPTLVEPEHSVLEMSPDVFDPLLLLVRARSGPDVDSEEGFAAREDDSGDFVRGSIRRSSGFREGGFERFANRR